MGRPEIGTSAVGGEALSPWAVGSALCGAGTALAYPTLLAGVVSDLFSPTTAIAVIAGHHRRQRL